MPNSTPQVLDVGGHDQNIPLPAQYRQWKRVILDIDASVKPDIVCDARFLCDKLPAFGYDAVYCSHNLEHYYHHDVTKVLKGFLHVLNDDGFVHIRVPDLKELMRRVVKQDLDLEDELYRAPIGSVKVRNVIYGYTPEVERSGYDYYAHKTGFTPQSLGHLLKSVGFKKVFIATADLEIKAIACKETVPAFIQAQFKLTPKKIAKKLKTVTSEKPKQAEKPTLATPPKSTLSIESV
jgi:hypothetical protein